MILYFSMAEADRDDRPSDFRTPSHDETIELLISTVSQYPFLYNAKDPRHRDGVLTAQTWVAIARVLDFEDRKYRIMALYIL